jgi:hypothetical protein
VHGSIKKSYDKRVKNVIMVRGWMLDVGDTPKALTRRLLPEFGDTNGPIDSFPDTPIKFTGYQEGELDLQKESSSGKRFTQEWEVG